MISTLKRTAVAVLLAATLGGASAGTPPLRLALILPGGSAKACPANVQVKLTGAQEVPPVKTSASGDAAISVQGDGTVGGKITTYGIRGTMAHIHEGAPGKNGPAIITLLRAPHGTWVVPRRSKLTPAQYKTFCVGNLYVNVHSAAHPRGEIRAQL